MGGADGPPLSRSRRLRSGSKAPAGPKVGGPAVAGPPPSGSSIGSRDTAGPQAQVSTDVGPGRRTVERSARAPRRPAPATRLRRVRPRSVISPACAFSTRRAPGGADRAPAPGRRSRRRSRAGWIGAVGATKPRWPRRRRGARADRSTVRRPDDVRRTTSPAGRGVLDPINDPKAAAGRRRGPPPGPRRCPSTRCRRRRDRDRGGP